MATLAVIARERKEGLKRLQKASLNLDAAQEKVEREVKRLLVRKRAIPESEDMVRVLSLISGTSNALDNMATVAQDLLNMYAR